MVLEYDQVFQLYAYESNLKACLGIYQLQGKSNLWWEEVKCVQLLEEKIFSQEEFQKQFKSWYLSECYCDDQAKEFHELRLGHLEIDEFGVNFTNIL